MKKGWPVIRLGDLTDLVTKGTTPTSIGHDFVEEGINFVKVESITTTGQFIEKKFAHITPACHAVLGRSQLQAGDILFSIAGALGRTGFVTDDILPANTNQALAIIRLKRDVGLSPKFVLKALETGVVLEQIEKFKGGVAQQNLSLAQVRDFQIALPPLAEQQRIVGLLDEAFEGLATAKANAEKNLQNARALFESHLQSVFTQRGPGWVEKHKPLSELCELIVDCEHKTAPIQEEGIPSIRTPNIGKGKLLLEGVNRVSDETYKAWTRRAEPLAGDLILAREAPAGNVAVIPENLRVCLGQRTVLIRPKADIFDPSFLAFCLLEPQMQEKLLAHSRGATVQHVNMKDIRALDVGAIPPLRIQQQISANVKAVSAEGERLARLYERKLAALEALKKSLLHQAFTGEL